MSEERAAGDDDLDGSAAVRRMPLFYSDPAPLDARTHAVVGLRQDFGFGFARGVNAVPVNLVELPEVCHSYPIAFSPDGEATPVAIVGVRDSENLFVNERGEWLAGAYIPAYVRRYPFIFSQLQQDGGLALCVDWVEPVIELQGARKFFEQDGSPTELSRSALEFCKAYHAAAQQTLQFSEALAASGLLVERQVAIDLGDGRRIGFTGFRAIDEAKLAAMADEEFLSWRSRGWLPFLYAQLLSAVQWQRLSELLRVRLEQESARARDA